MYCATVVRRNTADSQVRTLDVDGSLGRVGSLLHETATRQTGNVRNILVLDDTAALTVAQHRIDALQEEGTLFRGQRFCGCHQDV
jgi:hypothetical protein